MKVEQRDTLEQAAAKTGSREDDLGIMFPDVDIDLSLVGHRDGALSETEAGRQYRFFERAKRFHNLLCDA